MSGVVMLILVIVYSIAVFVIYHKIFDVYYFNLTSGIAKELFGSFIAGLILTVYSGNNPCHNRLGDLSEDK